jgi:clathrin heavy chain
MYGRALQFSTNAQDAQRIMLNSHAIPKEIMIEFFGKLSEEDCINCMNNLMRSNRQNGPLVAEIAVKYADKIDTKKSITVLESFGTNEGLLLFLCNVLPHTDDPDIYFKYIEACARMGNFKEVERVIKETQYYDAKKVKDFLMDGKFGDPRPLIYLCDMHGYIEDLTRYLYTTKQLKCIEIFLFKVNSNASPKVLGSLLDLDCDENYIKQLLNSIRVCPINELVDEFDSRGKLRLLTVWLEARYEDRIIEPALHNALAKIYIDSGNKDVQDFLIKNQYYDSKIIGKYCEERNPDLAFTAYKRAWGSCDEELIQVTNRNYLYRMQARYLVERQSPELWAQVLDPENTHRQQVIDQVVQTALPETKNVDEVSVTVSAFIEASLPNQLIELLERIVLHNSDFADNKSLQNLLILTAIRSDTTRVMDYINRLDNYDGIKLAGIAKEPQHALYEEALCIYKKFNEPIEAIRVLMYNLENIKSATEFAEKTNKPEVFSELGKAQLDNANLQACIEAFIKANDPSMFERVIFLSQS